MSYDELNTKAEDGFKTGSYDGKSVKSSIWYDKTPSNKKSWSREF